LIKEQVILDVLVICRLAFYFTLFLDYSLNLAPGSITTTSILFISEVTFGISTYAILFFIQTVIAVPFGAYWRLTFCALGTYQHIFFFFCYIFFYLSFFYCDFTLGLFNEIVHIDLKTISVPFQKEEGMCIKIIHLAVMNQLHGSLDCAFLLL